MANLEHLKILEQGVDVWNEWREEYPLIFPDLKKANLEVAKLQEANLRHTNLQEAHLFRADLQEAYLVASELQGANLEGANLQEAYLGGANLQGANLEGANLQRANLEGANLQGTNLVGADLSQCYLAVVKKTVFHWYYPVIWIFEMIKSLPYWKPLQWPKETNILYANASTMDASKNPLLKRWIEEQQFLHAFKRKSLLNRYFIYPIWKVLCDCGRSMSLWIFWSIVFAVGYAFIYNKYDLLQKTEEIPWGTFLSKLYFSVVTFTTLGFGDVVPSCPLGQWVIMSEVVIGYVMLGGLISIFANKLIVRM